MAITTLILLGEGGADQQEILISGVGAVGAILANFVAVIYLRMFRDIVGSMNTFHNRLVATHHLLFGNLLAARIDDRAKRDEDARRDGLLRRHAEPTDGKRTTGLEPRDLELGKLALYQLSYVRVLNSSFQSHFRGIWEAP